MTGFWDIFKPNQDENAGKETSGIDRVTGIEEAVCNLDHLDITGGHGEILSSFQEFSDTDLEEEKAITKTYHQNSKRFQAVCKLRGQRAEDTADNQIALRELQATYAKVETKMMAANVALQVTGIRQLPSHARMVISLDRAKQQCEMQMAKIGRRETWELEGDE